MTQGKRRVIDPTRFAPLLRRAREEAALTQEALAGAIGTTSRTVERWEDAFVPPSRSFHDPLVKALANASHPAWRAVVLELGVALVDALARVPLQAQKAAPPPPAPPPPPPAPPPVDPRVVLDDAVRAAAEDLDVSPRKVRAAFAQIVVDLERLGLSYAAARDLLLGRGKPPRERADA